MTLPGTTVSVVDRVPSRAAPTDTDAWFIVGFTEQGPLVPAEVDSLSEFVALFGNRVSYSVLYDAAQTFFEEGGSKLLVSRATGPSPVLATHTFNDTVPTSSLIVKAKSVGDWGNGISVAISHPDGTHFVLAISLNGTLVETSDSFTTQAQAVAWSAGSDYVDITLGLGTAIPAVATASLAGGTDDHASATDANFKTAIDLFTADFGPGQVSMPGRTTSQSYADQLAHAAANNRVAILDGADTASKATLTTAAGALEATTGGENGGFFAPWAVVPGINGSTPRTVPYSAVQAGIFARNDNAGLSPNVPGAGILNGQARYAIGVSQPAWSDTDRSALNDSGVNVVRIIRGGVVTYGNRTLANPSGHPDLLQLSNARLIMAIVAIAHVVGDRYVFAEIDGRGFKQADFAGDLQGEALLPFYTAGSLYGATPADAFAVDTGPTINPPSQLQAGLLKAMLYVKLSPAAERVAIQIVRTAITEVI